MTLAVGNIVGVRITGDPALVSPDPQAQQIQPSILQAQPPIFGNVLTVNGTEVWILWNNTVGAILDVATIADSNLDRITDPDPSEAERLLGSVSLAPRAAPRWVRHKSPFGDTTIDPSGGTSRSFDGTVVAVYRRTPVEVDDPTTGKTYCCICTEDGTYFEDVSSEFVVDDTR